MRIDVKKQLIWGPRSQRDRFFERAQELGVIEFIGTEESDRNDEIQLLIDALHVLRTMVPVKQAHPQHFYSPNMLARQIIDYKNRLENLYEQKRTVQKEIARIQPFGEFSLSTLKQIGEESGRIMQFFFAKSGKVNDLPSDVILINTAHQLDYFLSISKEKIHPVGLTEIIIERSLSDLRNDLALYESEIDRWEVELGALSHQKRVLVNGLATALNERHLEIAKGKTKQVVEDGLFVVESWIPKNKLEVVYQLADELNIYIEQIAIEKKDKVPTYLENRGWGRLGEDLVNIYDIPSNTDRDPSLWVFIAFGIFFAMIVADIGYGLVLLGITSLLFMKFRKKVSAGIRRAMKLGIWLGIGCIIWGVLLTSFFGIEAKPDSPLRKPSLVHWMVKRKASYFSEQKPEAYKELIQEYPEAAKASTPMDLLMSVNKSQDGRDNYVIYSNFTNNILIELSIFIGVIHILTSFGRYLDRRWSSLGWMIFLIGGYAYFPSVIKATSLIYFILNVPAEEAAQIGLWMIYGGIGLATLLAIIQNKWAGLVEPMHVISVFADVMSYLRIYALSLAGMIMASTFNHIGMSMPFYIGFIIILAGHLVNITLAMMGGVIHGLRLNFIEWYHYSFDGGGYRFRPLRTIKEENK